jgi:tetratricopeptide (TPR) repeat protein
LHDLGRFEEALEAVNRLHIYSDEGIMHIAADDLLGEALILKELGRSEEAIAALEKSQAMWTDFNDALASVRITLLSTNASLA